MLRSYSFRSILLGVWTIVALISLLSAYKLSSNSSSDVKASPSAQPESSGSVLAMQRPSSDMSELRGSIAYLRQKNLALTRRVDRLESALDTVTASIPNATPVRGRQFPPANPYPLSHQYPLQPMPAPLENSVLANTTRPSPALKISQQPFPIHSYASTPSPSQSVISKAIDNIGAAN